MKILKVCAFLYYLGEKLWEVLRDRTKKKVREGHSEVIKQKNKELENIVREKETLLESFKLEIDKMKEEEVNLNNEIEKNKDIIRQLDNEINAANERKRSVIEENENLNKTLKKQLESYKEKTVYIRENEWIDINSMININCHNKDQSIECQTTDTTFRFTGNETTQCESTI